MQSSIDLLKEPRVVSNASTLLNGFSRQQIAAALSPQLQEFILLPTEKCNFRCTYCYEDFKLGKMSASTQRAIELLVERRVANLRQLTFAWFGGEPLVAKEIVLRLSRHAKSRCVDNGVHFSGGLTTNAYVLDKSLAEELIDCNQDFFQVTFDGWQEGHDALRRRANGGRTFDRIWTNLLALRTLPSPFEVSVRVHVRRDNEENLHEFMRQYASAFEGDRRYRLNFQHLRDMGGEGGKTVVRPLSIQELRQIEARLRSTFVHSLEVRRHSQSQLSTPYSPRASTDASREWQSESEKNMRASDAGLITLTDPNTAESAGSRRSGDHDNGEPYVCYAAKANSLLIRANGRIGKCTVAFDDERNDIGYLADDGAVIVSNERLRPWIRGLTALDPAETGCPWHGLPSASLPSPRPGQGERAEPVTFFARPKDPPHQSLNTQ